jgi:hypothetical protein
VNYALNEHSSTHPCNGRFVYNSSVFWSRWSRLTSKPSPTSREIKRKLIRQNTIKEISNFRGALSAINQRPDPGEFASLKNIARGCGVVDSPHCV